MRIVKFLLTAYRRIMNNLRLFQVPGLVYTPCRYYPSCSDYAGLAIEKYGFWRGLTRSLFRTLRCNPLSKGGIDFP
ncbi:MAG: membrane protein insertion efficiency factor YidD [Candidatus Yanofskybacteria bacterium RIFCSPHIGHO2_01_FULL_48_25b]|uniref:Membrane protein insertion efficiency factor YidD n=1 Tax=Candidatus Yanofskybacteria bacterium RIFCSPHIGHO2_01_FULL_48_25b TaxID=1802672 RepID=A0A1F8F175_9BACT|nr:MAG: membrane protein insertion efficiency factor YidD [Candidatus Yanofskybacteria bacterium RIFCSPHIGHO2_01_FULL_48_25b]